MKTKKISKKMWLNKSTIANLSSSEMNRERGGFPTDFCTPACTLFGWQCTVTKKDCAYTEVCTAGTSNCITIC